MKQLSQIYLLLLLFLLLSGCSTVSYYSQAVSGHLSLMWSGKSVTHLIQRSDTRPELKHKLQLSQAARRFAEERLSLPVGGAFSDYVALDRPWVLVNLIAVPEFSLQPNRWCYPVVGCQAYRGYFSLEDARAEAADFQARDYDTFIGGVTAYSTLGWFDDPLHSGFTALPEDRMVALMFHELAHRVLYIDEDTAFNESFATAVELEGLKLWLELRGESVLFNRALTRLEHRRKTLELVEQASARLNRLYREQNALGTELVRNRKAQLLTQLAQAYADLSKHFPEPGPFGSPPVTLNNANLALFRQYNQHVPAFRQLLRDAGGDFPRFYHQVAALAEAPEAVRNQRLASLSQRFVEDL